MKFNYTAQNLSVEEYKWQRFFEILPGLTSWLIIVGLVVLTIFQPILGACGVIALMLYWILRLSYLTIFLLISFFRFSMEKEIDWLALAHLASGTGDMSRSNRTRKGLRAFKYRLAYLLHKKEIEQLRKNTQPVPSMDKLIHLVMIPIVNEPSQILEQSIQSLAGGSFSAKQLLVVLAVEERSSQTIQENAIRLQKRFQKYFYDFKIIVHPDGIPGEAKVKGANVTFAAKKMAAYFNEKGIQYENVILSCFDADTVVDPQYFACLTYQFLVCPDRLQSSFQPVPVYTNNIWQAHGFTRVLEMGASFFQLIEATNPEKLVTFSSHSMSFKVLADINYWPVDMISDDSSIFWKAFIYYDGHYQAVPLYVTVSMDVVDAGSWWRTAVNVYKQKRRWAWGIENFPIILRAFMKAEQISFYDKFRYAFKMFESHVSWATWAFILSFVGWVPALLASRTFSETVLYYTAPRITHLILNLSLGALIVSIILSLLMLPKRKVKHSFLKKTGFTLQWFLLPWTFIFLGALPALDAQTRLMFGKYMTFWVTEKKR
ncbi:MAG: hypothetical protein COV74_02790 [Candidatus Omnitrophica bacterium CG11_big_fil_rev_8_21_14_0_20_45_26]|uniref:Glycosyltransferase 2-like domain-containing protein n=1 Tax=Candidatus Abzuiibacterium crystallinum TaxID=1974748 RepID=A0A2H0LRA6_9BACT|nr:MAG: hypothetical protein COV74_02790 [Candidatus Omnitrophica bacterium CG11_big_fil_rev_8_21_14_0_20_45_26]PIW65551.1 MAG: hypothetical protein COW12_01130 [Candidatus Omnitrophica bacterium CG12_big_fil_rev_8_21_14_0_65_45_16]